MKLRALQDCSIDGPKGPCYMRGPQGADVVLVRGQTVDVPDDFIVNPDVFEVLVGPSGGPAAVRYVARRDPPAPKNTDLAEASKLEALRRRVEESMSRGSEQGKVPPRFIFRGNRAFPADVPVHEMDLAEQLSDKVARERGCDAEPNLDAWPERARGRLRRLSDEIVLLRDSADDEGLERFEYLLSHMHPAGPLDGVDDVLGWCSLRENAMRIERDLLRWVADGAPAGGWDGDQWGEELDRARQLEDAAWPPLTQKIADFSRASRQAAEVELLRRRISQIEGAPTRGAGDITDDRRVSFTQAVSGVPEMNVPPTPLRTLQRWMKHPANAAVLGVDRRAHPATQKPRVSGLLQLHANPRRKTKPPQPGGGS